MRQLWIGGLSLCLSACGGTVALDKAAQAAACDFTPVTQELLAAALVCNSDLAAATRTPILLVPGTTLDPQTNFDWNYMPAFDALSWPWCSINLPGNAMGDIQEAAEYVAYAIVEMHRRSGRKVQVAGYSQGGMVPRWAFKYWPQTRAMVEDLVSFSASNHGTVIAAAACEPDCAPAIWQQRDTADFIAALNAGDETYPEIAYSNIYTLTDEVVVPNTPPSPSSALSGGDNVVNVALQEVCPNNTADHLAIGTYDAVAWALALDALDNAGPVDPSRVPLTACLPGFMPGVQPARFATDYANFLNVLQQTLAETPHVPQEPPLKCYVSESQG